MKVIGPSEESPIANQSLLAELNLHSPSDNVEYVHLRRMIRFAQSDSNPFDRSNPERHFVGSGIVVSPDAEQVLLIYHKRLERWLQFGGHAKPGESSGLLIAIRETREESGARALRIARNPPLVDVDIHIIPRRGAEAPHEHFDLRYLFVLDPSESLHMQESEVKEIRWFRWAELGALALEGPLCRALERALP